MRMIIATIMIWFGAAPAFAWLRPQYEDADVVARSELIVVGAIKPGSIQYVPHKPDASGAHSWEHHAILLVHQVLKGTCQQKEIPIVIYYGLEPLIDGQSKHDGFEMNIPPGKGVPAGEIDIFDEGNSIESFEPLLQNAQTDNLWLLRRLSGEYGRKPGHGDYGIVDPEDVEPLSLKDYFACYLSKDPESAVRAQLQKQPEIAERATLYVEHLEVARILPEPNPAIRVERLLPYYLSGVEWGWQGEARRGIVAAGPVAGPYLRGIFDRSWNSEQRQDIIRLWGEIRYAGSVDPLIALLKREDRFWASQKLNPGWWNTDVSSQRTQNLRNNYGEVYDAVIALEQIGDPKARDAIDQTRKCWAAINFENHQIVDECDAALKKLPAP